MSLEASALWPVQACLTVASFDGTREFMVDWTNIIRTKLEHSVSISDQVSTSPIVCSIASDTVSNGMARMQWTFSSKGCLTFHLSIFMVGIPSIFKLALHAA